MCSKHQHHQTVNVKLFSGRAWIPTLRVFNDLSLAYNQLYTKSVFLIRFSKFSDVFRLHVY